MIKIDPVKFDGFTVMHAREEENTVVWLHLTIIPTHLQSG